MALHLPAPRTRATTQKSTDLEGLPVHVALGAARAVAAAKRRGVPGLRAPEQVSVRRARAEIGIDGIRRAAHDAGRTPPSARTVRRWVKEDRIPSREVADLVQRRALIERHGGVEAFAALVGRSRSSVLRYQSGKTRNLRGQGRKKLDLTRAQDAAKRAGMLNADGSARVARIRMRAGVSVTSGVGFEYDYRARKHLDFGTSRIPFSDQESRELALALAADDDGRVVAILEQHATLNWSDTDPFDEYGEDMGFKFDDIESLEVEWGEAPRR
jgi:hypothetical protein